MAFTGEGDVVDVGGPLDEAIMITYDKLFSDDTLWTKRPDGFFEPKATSTAAGAKRWAQFGGLLGLTILRSNALGPRFNQSFFARLHAALHYHTYLNDAEYLPNTPTIKATSAWWGLQSAIKTPNDLLGDLMQDDECSAQQKALFSWLCEPNESTRARLATSIGCQDKAVLASDQNMQEYLDILCMPTTSEEALTDALGAVLPIAKGLAKYCPDLAGRCLATGPSTVQMVMNGPTLPLRETLLLAIDAGHRETLHETIPSALRSERDRAHKLLRSFIEDQRVSEALLEKLLVEHPLNKSMIMRSKYDLFKIQTGPSWFTKDPLSFY